MRPPTPAWRIVIRVLRMLVRKLGDTDREIAFAELKELEGLEEIETP